MVIKGPSEGEAPASARRINAAARLLSGPHDDVVRVLDRLEGDELFTVAEAVRQLQRLRALARGDLDEIIATAFEIGFGRDGIGLLPWVEGDVIVCPGGLTSKSKSKSSHKCRFVSIDDTWIWESNELIREDKRSTPGTDGGFRAVALVPLVDGMELDVVSGKARQGQHSIDLVISYEVRRRELIEVSQRTVAPAGMQ